jgi:AraC family transcriptional regulator of adaptative response/methylated-DNA-[protein]-cysteine methyltransferase
MSNQTDTGNITIQSCYSNNQYIRIVRMFPEEYRENGKYLEIHYSFAEGPFGRMLIASTPKGICSVTLAKDEKSAVESLKQMFPNAYFLALQEASHKKVLSYLTPDSCQPENVILHLKGTEFQLKVWKALLDIPMGELSSYGKIAKQISNPKACRAVGNAVGDNPVFFLIPCHRVIQSSGAIGKYYWGTTLKTVIIKWEASLKSTHKQ